MEESIEIALNDINIIKQASNIIDENSVSITVKNLAFTLSEVFFSANRQLEDYHNNTALNTLISNIKINDVNFNTYIPIISMSPQVKTTNVLGYLIKKYDLSDNLTLVLRYQSNILDSITFLFKENSKCKFDYNKIISIIHELLGE